MAGITLPSEKTNQDCSSTIVERSVVTKSADETRRIAAALGRILRAGDTISLTGDLGAGKTTFTQGLALGLEIPCGVLINSPTFTILAEHLEGRVPLYHFDVYRLTGSEDLHDLAFDEYLDGSGVVVVEWADRIADALPPDTLFVSLAPSPHSPETENWRNLRLTGSAGRSAEIIRALALGEGE